MKSKRCKKGEKGFTLSEALMTLALIGVIAVIIFRALNILLPDQNKVLFLKAFHTMKHALADIINDPLKYNQEFYDQADPSKKPHSVDFSQAPLQPAYNRPPTVDVNGKTLEVNVNNAICLYTAEKLQITGTVNCNNNSTANYTTTNGMVWMDLVGAVKTNKTIRVDVNGPKDGGEYRIIIYEDGRIDVPTGSTEETIIKGQGKISH